MLSIIVAVAENNVIGKDNKLIWKISDDLKRFKRLTSGHSIIMGRKTFDSLGRVLPNRKHIILTRNENFNVDNENVSVVHDVKEIKKFVDSEEESFIIGGAEIYKLLMPYANKIYLTSIKKEFDGDAYFPEISEDEWKIIKREKGPDEDNNLFEYEYIDFERR